MQNLSKPTALVILMDGVEELEAVAPIDCLRRAGVAVTTAAAGSSPTVTGRNGIALNADELLAETRADRYHMIVLPGGPGHAALRKDEKLRQRLQQQAAAGRWVASICAGPLVLKDAGLLEGRSYTSFPGTADELPERDPGRAVVRDGFLITSQGAGTAILFALELVSALCGREAAAEVAASICHPGT